jgi:peroxiredoxin
VPGTELRQNNQATTKPSILMKKLLILFIVILMISCKKMDHYEIIGTVQNMPDSTILSLFEISENVGSLVATDTIINSKFRFTGTLSNKPTRMNLLIMDRLHFAGSCEFWVDHTKIKITGTDKFLSTWNVTSNLSEQKVSNLFNEKTRSQMKKIDSLSLSRMADPRNRDLQISSANEISSISKDISNIEFDILKYNHNSLTSLNKLYKIAEFSSIDREDIMDIFNKFDEKYKKTLLGEGILAKLDKPVPPKIGDKLIDLDLYNLDGKQFKLSDFSGRYILLDFWSLACYPCILAAPELRQINEIYKDDLTIVGINMDVSLKFWTEATKRDSITWKNLSDGKGSYAGASSLYGISGMPTYILINQGDTIVERWEGFSTGIFKEKLKKYFDQK